MAVIHALDAIIKHRQHIRSSLSDSDRRHFEDLIRRLRDADEQQRPVQAIELISFLDDTLPRDHPVLRALAIDTQDMSVTMNLDAIFEEMHLTFEMDDAGETDAEPDVAFKVRKMLWRHRPARRRRSGRRVRTRMPRASSGYAATRRMVSSPPSSSMRRAARCPSSWT